MGSLIKGFLFMPPLKPIEFDEEIDSKVVKEVVRDTAHGSRIKIVTFTKNDNFLYLLMSHGNEENICVTNLEELLNKTIDSFIDAHRVSYRTHEELMSMSYADSDIREIFSEGELAITDKVVSVFKKNGFIVPDMYEKVHIIVGLVDKFCHEVVYHAHDNMNYDVMKREIIDIIIYILCDKKK